MRAQGNNANYVQYNLTAPASVYDARFMFRPNANKAAAQVVFAAATSRSFSTTAFRVRYRLNGAIPQVQVQVGTSTTNAAWANIASGSTSNAIGVVWQAAKSATGPRGTLTLMVGGVVVQTLPVSSTAAIGAIRLGSVLNGSSAVAEYFDAFSSGYSAAPIVTAPQPSSPRHSLRSARLRWLTSRPR
jgi:hypothetical protein